MEARLRLVLCIFVLLAANGGCRREQQSGATATAIPEAANAPEQLPAEEAAQPNATDAGTDAPRNEGPTPPAEPIDLLRGARTALAVSSAYRDKQGQVARLVDGLLETAWNSRTGDLVGAWIEVRLPADATVTSIALTSGFTKATKTSDLFAGNHRVSKVRVSRGGQEVGIFDLDTESRELQTLPVKGGGGIYRIEILGVVPGTKTRWREVCISELRVMGHAPVTNAGKRFPNFDIGELPEPRQEPGTDDRAEVSRSFRGATQWLIEEWEPLLDAQASRDTACGLDDSDVSAAKEYRNKRRLVFNQVAKLVAKVDEIQADTLRAEAYKQDPQGHSGWGILFPSDHGSLAAGFDSVANWLGDDESLCRWSRVDMGLRLFLVENELQRLRHGCEHISMNFDETYPAPPELLRDCRINDRLMPRLSKIRSLWRTNPRQAATQIARIEWPENAAALMSEWVGVEDRVEILRRTCGWVSE